MEATVKSPASETAFSSSHPGSEKLPPLSLVVVVVVVGAVSVRSISMEDPKSSARYDRVTPNRRITEAIFTASKTQLLLDEILGLLLRLLRRDNIRSVPAFVDGPVTMSATEVPAENPIPRSASASDTIPCSQIVMGRLTKNRPARLAIDWITEITSAPSSSAVAVDEKKGLMEDECAEDAADVGGTQMEAHAETTTPRKTHTATDEKSSTEVVTNSMSDATTDRVVLLLAAFGVSS